jgi:serine/threonine protein phosphatase PrpC
VDVAYRSDTGQTRRRNEDFAGYYEPSDPHDLAVSGRLYVVADGVGGAAAGEVASRYAVRKVLWDYFAAGDASNNADCETRLVGAIETASLDIYQFTQSRPQPMATTLVAALLREDELMIANVGDSRAYLIRSGEIRQVTEDHSLVAQMVRQGRIDQEDAATHPKRNLLTRTVGGSEAVEVDVFGGPLKLGDIIVLCTDGLTRYVSEDEITHAVRTMQPQQAVDELTAMANLRGGKDNITVLVLQVVEPDDDLDTERRAPAVQQMETPDLENELARTIVEKHPFEGPWWRVPPSYWSSSVAIAAAAAIVIGVILLVLGASGGGDAPAETPTQTFDAGLVIGAEVSFVRAASVRERPSSESGEVAIAAAGQLARVLGQPRQDDDGVVWHLLNLTGDGQPVTGWVVQSALQAGP